MSIITIKVIVYSYNITNKTKTHICSCDIVIKYTKYKTLRTIYKPRFPCLRRCDDGVPGSHLPGVIISIL